MSMTKGAVTVMRLAMVGVLLALGITAACGSGTSAPVVTITATPMPTPSNTFVYTPEPTPEATVFESKAGLSKADYQAKSRVIAYKVLNKEADQLVGRLYRLTGQIFQIQDAGPGMYSTAFNEGTGRSDLQAETNILLAITKDEFGYYNDNVMVLYPTAVKVYEGDVITVWAECLGSYTYQSVANYNLTVPLLWAKYITKVS
jgi:hypothetical protein